VVERISHSLKASGGKKLKVQEPIAGRDGTSFDFHPTLPTMLGATLIRDEVIQMG